MRGQQIDSSGSASRGAVRCDRTGSEERTARVSTGINGAACPPAARKGPAWRPRTAGPAARGHQQAQQLGPLAIEPAAGRWPPGRRRCRPDHRVCNRHRGGSADNRQRPTHARRGGGAGECALAATFRSLPKKCERQTGLILSGNASESDGMARGWPGRAIDTNYQPVPKGVLPPSKTCAHKNLANRSVIKRQSAEILTPPLCTEIAKNYSRGPRRRPDASTPVGQIRAPQQANCRQPGAKPAQLGPAGLAQISARSMQARKPRRKGSSLLLSSPLSLSPLSPVCPRCCPRNFQPPCPPETPYVTAT